MTCEDQEDNLYTDQTVLPNNGYVYERILTALLEIHNHVKKNSDIIVTGGNFHFKLDSDDKPVLVFASSIKTERPIIVLNSAINVALCLTENLIIQPTPVVKSQAVVHKQPGFLSNNSHDELLPALNEDMSMPDFTNEESCDVVMN